LCFYRYEDIAMNPVPFARSLLGIAGLTLYAELEDYIRNVTQAEPRDNSKPQGIKVHVTNSTHEAFLWRENYDYRTRVRLVDEACEKVYWLAGYLPLANLTATRDLTVPSILPLSQITGFLNPNSLTEL
jgi:hypothetical protein